MILTNSQVSHAASKAMMVAFVVGSALAGATVGCASILGIETGDKVASDDSAGGRVADPDTEILTTPQCVEYCDAVMTNCTADNTQYQSRAACINTCNYLPPGSAQDAEPSSNTVLCRMKQAQLAEEFASDVCAAAGPGGNEECGTNCETWCQLLSEVCVEDFQAMSDCRASCATIPGGEFFDLSGYEDDKNDIQCRISHLGAAAGSPEDAQIHCDHARFSPVGSCLGGETELSCARYCQSVTGACQGDSAVYKDAIECEASCVAFELGEDGDESGNTIACRDYHSGAALSIPETHCPHAGPSGDGHCGDLATGNCESYCRVYRAGCSAEFQAEFVDDLDTCRDACVEAGLEGTEGNSGYSHLAAPDADDLRCRIRRSVEARTGTGEGTEHDDLCARAKLSGSCK